MTTLTDTDHADRTDPAIYDTCDDCGQTFDPLDEVDVIDDGTGVVYVHAAGCPA